MRNPSIAVLLLAACAAPSGDESSTSGAPSDSAFAEVQERGADPGAMGVDQYTSSHHFEDRPDGGRIELQRDVEDSAGVAQIRRHMREIAAAFSAGDFRIPGFVHDMEVPGTPVMSERSDVNSWLSDTRPRVATLITSPAASLACAARSTPSTTLAT